MNWWNKPLIETNNMDSVNQERVGFEEIQAVIQRHSSQEILISTLPENKQHCLIRNTISIPDEITTLNESLEKRNWQLTIYIYGLNHTDKTVERKQQQLKKMGFRHVHVYLGGLFEWLLLQDVYGNKEFPTTSIQTDILQYKP